MTPTRVCRGIGLATVIAALLFAGTAASVAADSAGVIVDFEDVPTPKGAFILPTREGFAYAGYQWHGFYVLDSQHPLTDQVPDSGFRTGLTSGRYVAVAGNRSVDQSVIRSQDSERFDLRSARIASGWRNGLLVRFEAKRGDETVELRELRLDVARPRLVELDFADVDAVVISSRGGRDAGVCVSPICSDGPEVVIDDIVFAPPSTVELSKVAEPPVEAAADEPQPAPETTQAEPFSARAERAADPPRAARPVSRETVKPKTKLQDTIARQAKAKRRESREPSEPGGAACAEGAYYGVQVGAFRSRTNAVKLAASLREAHGAAQVHVFEGKKGPLHLVIAGCFADKTGASELSKQFEQEGQEGVPVRASEARFGPLLEP